MGGNKLLIVGDRAFAEIAYEYFTHDSEYEVAAFSVERDFLGRESVFGIPVVPFEELDLHFDPARHKVFVALTYARLNRVRTRLCREAKGKGFGLATYVSSNAFVWRNVSIGENCFIFENNVIQPFVRIGDNVIIWSGNHIGHHSAIGDNCFISSHVVVSGFVEVGCNCFLGVNSTIANDLRIAEDCVIGAGALVLENTEKGRVYKGSGASASEAVTSSTFRAQESDYDLE